MKLSKVNELNLLYEVKEETGILGRPDFSLGSDETSMNFHVAILRKLLAIKISINNHPRSEQ